MDNPTLTILVIDDDAGDMHLVRDMRARAVQENLDFWILEASSLNEGLTLLSTHAVDLVLLTLMLPDCQGLPIVDRIMIQSPVTPIVVITGHEDEKTGLEAVRKGAQDYLVKGEVDGSLLLRVIRCAIERGRTAREQLEIRDGLTSRARELEKFADYLSHNIKNNVLVIKRIVDLAEFNPEFVITNAGMLATSCDNLMNIINRLLEYARAGKAVTRKTELSLSPVITKLFEKTKPADMEGELIFRQPLPSLLCDALKVEKLFLHLLENSIHYRDREKQKLAIVMDYERAPDCIILKYRDNGSGIEGESIGHIFDSWYTSRKEEHLGIGLTIVKKTVEAHGGSISARSGGRGQGTEFTMSFPHLLAPCARR